VTHDDDWCALIEDVCMSHRCRYNMAHSLVKTDEYFPDDEELLIRVSRKYTPFLESGMQHELQRMRPLYIFRSCRIPSAGVQWCGMYRNIQ
jgi:hypothetical protein